MSYRELSRDEALKLLLEHKKVYMIHEDDMRLADLDQALGQRMIADISDELGEIPKETQVVEPSDTNNLDESQEQSASNEQVKSPSGRKLIERTCKFCGKTFMGGPASKFCSDNCREGFKNYGTSLQELKRQDTPLEKVTVIPQLHGIENNYSEDEVVSRDCKHRDCTYRSNNSNVGTVTCDYLINTGQERGCKISECDKYKPRKGNERKSIF